MRARARRATLFVLGFLAAALGGLRAEAQTVRVCAHPALDPGRLGAALRTLLADVPASERAYLGFRVSACTGMGALVTVTYGNSQATAGATFTRPTDGVEAVALAAMQALRVVRARGSAAGVPAPGAYPGQPTPGAPPSSLGPYPPQFGVPPGGSIYDARTPDDPDFLEKTPFDANARGLVHAAIRRSGDSEPPQRRLDLSFDAGLRAYVRDAPTGAYTLRMRAGHRRLLMDVLYGTNRLTGVVAQDQVRLHILAFGMGLRHAFPVRRVELSVGALVDVNVQFLRAMSSIDTQTSLGGGGGAGVRLDFELSIPIDAHRIRVGFDAGINNGVTAVAVDFLGDRVALGGFRGPYVGFHLGYGRARRATP